MSHTLKMRCGIESAAWRVQCQPRLLTNMAVKRPDACEPTILNKGCAEMTFGAIAIGRNEGDRLKQCLRSLVGAAVLVYVDSGSTDGSVQWARDYGIDV